MRTLYKLTWVEIKLFIREPITMAFTFALPLMTLFVMGGVFGNTPDANLYRGAGPMDYYLPAYIGLVISSIGVLSLPAHLTNYRERGVLKRLRATSISIWSIFGSQLIVSFIIAILGAILMSIVALLIYDAHLPEEPGLLILGFILSVLGFSALGVLLGALLPTTRAAQGLGIILYFVMLMLAGAGPPREVMTAVMQNIGDITPLRYVILMLQDPWLGFGWNVKSSIVVSGILIAASLISIRFFKWD